MEFPKIILEAVDSFSSLPGVGKKSALRQVLSLTKWNALELEAFGNSISELSQLNHCESCGLFAESRLCHICDNQLRVSSGRLCVVESISDCMAIEKSENYPGIYHILGGVLNPLLGIGPDELGLDKILEKVKELGLSEVVLAINPSVEGDATCSYINSILSDHCTVERIGFGIPIGGSLEYLDPLTISKALENRKTF